MQKTVAPEKPFLCYIAPAAQYAKPEWIAKYKGRFDQGWDKLREETFARQRQMGIIPADAKLTPRPKEMPSWDSMNEGRREDRHRERRTEMIMKSLSLFCMALLGSVTTVLPNPFAS